MFVSPIDNISKPIVWAADGSSYRRSIQLAVALGGRYAVHIRKGYDFGRDISAHMGSIFNISNSDRCLQLMFFKSIRLDTTSWEIAARSVNTLLSLYFVFL